MATIVQESIWTLSKPQDENGSRIEVSVVMPCLNEADTLGVCIEKAQRAFAENHIRGEIVVADNGSTDGSQHIAVSMGARVVDVRAKGYGNALIGGMLMFLGKKKTAKTELIAEIK